MQIVRLDSPVGNALHGGVLCVFEDKRAYRLEWERSAPVIDTLQGAKDLTARLVDQLIREDQRQRLHSLNLPSVVAAMQRCINEWNEARRAALYGEVQLAGTVGVANSEGQGTGGRAPFAVRGSPPFTYTPAQTRNPEF